MKVMAIKDFFKKKRLKFENSSFSYVRNAFIVRKGNRLNDTLSFESVKGLQKDR